MCSCQGFLSSVGDCRGGESMRMGHQHQAVIKTFSPYCCECCVGSCSPAGVLLAVWGGPFLPADSSAVPAGALEDRAGMRTIVSRVCCCSRGSRAGWEGQCERAPHGDWRGFPRGQRRALCLPECHTHQSLPAQWLLPPELCAGRRRLSRDLPLVRCVGVTPVIVFFLCACRF